MDTATVVGGGQATTDAARSAALLSRGVQVPAGVLGDITQWMAAALPDEGAGFAHVTLPDHGPAQLGDFVPAAPVMASARRVVIAAVTAGRDAAIVHSHPGAVGRPSPPDRDQIVPGRLHLILGHPDDPTRTQLRGWVRRWMGPVQEVSLTVIGDGGAHG